MSTPASLVFQSALSASEWNRREARHLARVAPLAEDFLRRRRAGTKHPVWDFLFTYYSFSPGKLLTWCPALAEGVGRELVPGNEGHGRTQAFPAIPERVVAEARWIARLCGNIAGRPPRFQCHGLHEWAMVYRQSAAEVRHAGYELRMSPEELARFVESQALCCSHYDAFRFFTPEARPLNSLAPDRETRLDLEQGGCLHANMDLYKWAYKLWPWIGSDLVADAFEVAVAGRELDMRASPYDLEALGFSPIAIETEAGREAYRAGQRRIWELAGPVRARLGEAAAGLADRAGVS